jgi:HEAT repeat protein
MEPYVKLGASHDVDTLVAAMLVDDEDARYESALALARLGQPAVEAAAALVESPSARARDMGCYVLGQVSDPAEKWYVKLRGGIPTLLRVLETDREEWVRASAAYALGHQAAEEATPLLCELVVAADAEARYSAAWALGSFGESAWERSPHLKELAEGALLMLTHDVDDEVRDWAVFGLHQADHDTPAVRARMWQTLDDSCPEVRGESAAGLAKFGDRTFIPRLMHLLVHDVQSPLYFEAAEAFGDPVLLPAVLAGEQRWRDDLDEGEQIHGSIPSAVAALKAASAAHRL